MPSTKTTRTVKSAKKSSRAMEDKLSAQAYGKYMTGTNTGARLDPVRLLKEV